VLSGKVPGVIRTALGAGIGTLLNGAPVDEIAHWAVHPGGRSVLDAVEQALALPPPALAHSRAVLRGFGNMSSATVLFVLERMLAEPDTRGEPGCALAFGPGVAAEAMTFRMAA
jgi:predicted naringenin-chalcone synthase